MCIRDRSEGWEIRGIEHHGSIASSYPFSTFPSQICAFSGCRDRMVIAVSYTHLIEENHTIWFAAYSLGQLTTFIVAYIPWRLSLIHICIDETLYPVCAG